MPSVRRYRSRSRSTTVCRRPSLVLLPALVAVALALAGVASAHSSTDAAMLQTRLDATEAELGAASEALRALRDALAQGKRFVVTDGLREAPDGLGALLPHARPLVLGTREQAIAAITFAYLFGLGEDDAFDAAVLADLLRRYVREAQHAVERVAWLEGRVVELERRRDELRAEIGALDPARSCIHLVRVAHRIQVLGDARPDPMLELSGALHRYVSPETVGLGVQRYGGIVLEWTPPPASICEGDRFVLTFSAVNMGPSEQRGGTGGRVQMTREGGVPTFECTADALAAAMVLRHERSPAVNVCTFTVGTLATAQLDPRAQFTVSTSGTARGAVITYHYAR